MADPRVSLTERFTEMHQSNVWGNKESVSGWGSTFEATSGFRDELSRLLTALRAKSVLDLPCGDFNWMKHVPLGNIQYVGADIVQALVIANQQYVTPSRTFIQLDITKDKLPKSDVIICRDCLVHLSFENIRRALNNIQASKSKYIVLTTFPNVKTNVDVEDGRWRPLNFEIEPFNFPKPLATIVEGCRDEDGAYADKSLFVWKVNSLEHSWIAAVARYIGL